MDNDQISSRRSDATEESPEQLDPASEPSDSQVDEAPDGDASVIEVIPVEPDRPVSETVGTGSIFGIGCSIVALLFVCVGIAIFMWRQVN